MLKRLWVDEGGALLSAELVLLMTICVIGLIVGMVALRDMVVTELADVGASIGSLNQTYAFAGTSGSALDGTTFTAGSTWEDSTDLSEIAGSQGGSTSLGISLSEAPIPEGGP